MPWIFKGDRLPLVCHFLMGKDHDKDDWHEDSPYACHRYKKPATGDFSLAQRLR